MTDAPTVPPQDSTLEGLYMFRNATIAFSSGNGVDMSDYLLTDAERWIGQDDDTDWASDQGTVDDFETYFAPATDGTALIKMEKAGLYHMAVNDAFTATLQPAGLFLRMEGWGTAERHLFTSAFGVYYMDTVISLHVPFAGAHFYVNGFRGGNAVSLSGIEAFIYPVLVHL